MIRLTDMIDPVYTLATIAGLDPEEVRITSINIGDHTLIVRYIDKDGVARHVSQPYDL